jgi:hypothetical protein
MHKLKMRPGCERRDTDLPPDSDDARIRSFERTFRAACTDAPLAGRCPNCAGVPRVRPTRGAEPLAEHPATMMRTHNPPSSTWALQLTDA